MPEKILWSPLAEQDLDNLISYLIENWGYENAVSFINRLEDSVFLISVFPRQFPEINTKLKVRKCVLTKHNSIFYKVDKNYIEILRIFDARQKITPY